MALIQDALINASSKDIITRHPDPLKPSLCHGTEITLTLDETHLPDHNVFLLGRVIHQFLTNSCTVNSFVSLKLISQQRGELYTWQPLLGVRGAM